MSLIDAIEMAEGEAIDETHQGVLAYLDQTGHTKQVWDINRPESVAIARATFEEARRQGCTIYRVDADGEPTTVMGSFEPEAGKFITGKYVAAPRMVGG